MFDMHSAPARAQIKTILRQTNRKINAINKKIIEMYTREEIAKQSVFVRRVMFGFENEYSMESFKNLKNVFVFWTNHGLSPFLTSMTSQAG